MFTLKCSAISNLAYYRLFDRLKFNEQSSISNILSPKKSFRISHILKGKYICQIVFREMITHEHNVSIAFSKMYVFENLFFWSFSCYKEAHLSDEYIYIRICIQSAHLLYKVDLVPATSINSPHFDSCILEQFLTRFNSSFSKAGPVH